MILCWLWRGGTGPRVKEFGQPLKLGKARILSDSPQEPLRLWSFTQAANRKQIHPYPWNQTRPNTALCLPPSLAAPNSKNIGSCSVAKLCPTLRPMDCSMPGFPVLHYLLEFAQIQVHWVGDAIQPSHPLLPSSLAFSLSQHEGLFQMSQYFASDVQSIWALMNEWVLPMNIQSWFPLGLTSLISLQSKGLSRVFPSITIQKHQFFDAQPSLWPHSHNSTWLLGKPEFWLYKPFFGKVMSLLFNMLSTFVIPFLPRSMSNACDPVDCSLSGSSVHGISQARILKWVAVSCSRGPRIKCLLISQKGSQTN